MAASGADLASPKLHTEDGFVLFAGGGFGSGGQPRGDGAGEWNQGQHEQTGPTSWLAERFLLVRREVARAVGGVDEGYEHDPMAVVDFCLKARQRDFDCVYLGSVDFEHYGPEPALDPATDLRRLAAKWAAFPDLLAPGKD
jgi:GT2 family glycosyltransferase